MQWSEEEIYHEKEAYFAAVLAAVQSAQKTIEVETYILEFDALGKSVLEALDAAAKRGVQVRVIVDGAGSFFDLPKIADFLKESSLQIKVYHSLNVWRLFRGRGLRLGHFTKFFARLNKRLHRKVFIIDAETLFGGGFNIIDADDRDTGIRVKGEEIDVVRLSFDKLWSRPDHGRVPIRPASASLIRLNDSRAIRRNVNQDLARRLKSAVEKIWITNAYFVPPLFLLNALREGARRGVDARLLISSRTDHWFMNWIMKTYYRTLLRAGVRVFEYQQRFLHAKTLLVDDWGTVGSSNLNHRSLIHDLEIDIVVSHAENRQLMVEQYQRDLKMAVEVDKNQFKGAFFLSLIFEQALRLFRYWV